MEVKTKKAKEQKKGVLKRIAGPVVTAVNLDAHMYDVVKVGKEALMGEVIKIQGDSIIIQVYRRYFRHTARRTGGKHRPLTCS